MFIIDFFPYWLIHSIVLAGIVGVLASFFFGFIPFIKRYTLPIQVISTVLLVAGVWLEGGISNNNRWEQKVAKLELQLSKKETKAAEVTVQTVTKYVDRVKVIKEKGEKEYVKVPEYIVQYDSTCQLPDAFLMLYDDSNKADFPKTSRNSDEDSRKSKEASRSQDELY